MNRLGAQGKTPPTSVLGVDEEQALTRRWQDGDRAAGGALVQHHRPLLTAIARQFSHPTLEKAELVHVSSIGFLKGALRFNPQKAHAGRLAPYARWWARAEVAAFVYEMRRLIGLSRYVEQAITFILSHGPDNPKSREYLRSPAIRDALLVEERVLSLDAPLDHDDGEGGPHTLEMRLSDGSETPEAMVMLVEGQGKAHEAIHAALGRLSEAERVVVLLRCMTDPPVPPAEVAAGLGISEGSVALVQKRALGKLGPLVRQRLDGRPTRGA